MDGSQVERIDGASMDILENVGVVFRDDIALANWKRVGAKVVGETVYLDRGLVRELIASIPSGFTYHARNSKNNARLGGKNSVFVPMVISPFLTGSSRRIHAAVFSFIAGVMPPIPMLGRSLL